ncbi:winged helix DNA-binding domain-containing protein [Schizophyllum commune H4-8]|uniref:Fork-head domain-containing protein n=1 Tax=Schizophyllum commune (strain H4-8 / FGSC 9210) TaxID=578458 RepID=D8QJZ4_SCHCM|nr:winged helix DNA-binding domain-containing protein [Schizophyllum commune H4-8]KAI5885631.1 winged helix DNA-binding domain-containing protein [Schizophyllum commune H4-8]
MAGFNQSPSRTSSPSTTRHGSPGMTGRASPSMTGRASPSTNRRGSPALDANHQPYGRPLSGYSMHSGQPKIGLESLRDSPPGQKPLYQYSTLIYHAIKGSNSQRLTLEEIYRAIETRYSYFQTAPPEWKTSVLHHLSMNPVFEKVSWAGDKREFWTVNEEATNRPVAVRLAAADDDAYASMVQDQLASIADLAAAGVPRVPVLSVYDTIAT